MTLTADESVVVAKLKSQGCSVDAACSTALSIAMGFRGSVFFIPKDDGHGFLAEHYLTIGNEVERWGLELLPLDRLLG